LKAFDAVGGLIESDEEENFKFGTVWSGFNLIEESIFAKNHDETPFESVLS